MKLKKKINNTVQILTHVKEKLQFVNGENEKQGEQLAVNDELVKKVRHFLVLFFIKPGLCTGAK